MKQIHKHTPHITAYDTASDAGGRHFYPNDPKWQGYPKDKTVKPGPNPLRREKGHLRPGQRGRRYVPGNQNTFDQNA